MPYYVCLQFGFFYNQKWSKIIREPKINNPEIIPENHPIARKEIEDSEAEDHVIK